MACACGSSERIQTIKKCSNGAEHLGLYCSVCNKFIKWVPQEKVNLEMVMQIGVHKGKTLVEIYTHFPDYCMWFSKQRGSLAGKFEALLDYMETKI